MQKVGSRPYFLCMIHMPLILCSMRHQTHDAKGCPVQWLIHNHCWCDEGRMLPHTTFVACFLLLSQGLEYGASSFIWNGLLELYTKHVP